MSKKTKHPKTPNVVTEQDKGCRAPASGSALARRIARYLMTEPWMNRRAARLQLRGPKEEDWGGLCRDSVIRMIDAVLTQNTKVSE